jgi:hypothetical protein
MWLRKIKVSLYTFRKRDTSNKALKQTNGEEREDNVAI